MKLNLKSLKRLRALPRKRKRDTAGDYMNPLRDWAIGLGVASVLFLVGVGFIFYDFRKQFVNESAVDVTENEVPRYAAPVVREYARIYNEREVRFEKLRSEKFISAPPVQEEKSIMSSSTEAIGSIQTGESPLPQ